MKKTGFYIIKDQFFVHFSDDKELSAFSLSDEMDESDNEITKFKSSMEDLTKVMD